MSVAAPDQDLDSGPRQAARERFCAATGVARAESEMIRFVLGPEGAAVLDLKRKLPGRGLWVTATREALVAAVARKAFARGCKREVRLAIDLVDSTERLLAR